jgi:isoleucyl-tRNA synthetase
MAARPAAFEALEKGKQGGIDNPLDAEVILADPRGEIAAVKAELPDLFGVSRVSISAGDAAPSVKDLRSEPRCERSWKRDGTVRARSDGGMLSDRDALAVGV